MNLSSIIILLVIEYEGIALSIEERDRLVQDMGTYRCMILGNHGLFVTRNSIACAFHEIYFLKRAYQIQI